MTKTALITGASAGIGREYAEQLARRGAHLVLVARDKSALDELATSLRDRYKVEVEVLAADLLKKRNLDKVVQRVGDHTDPIDLLINNAGFGLDLDFASNDIEAEVDHLHLHVEVPMRLMHAALDVMRIRGGRIINVASVAGFIPRSTYGACKGWLISFSRWANTAYENVSVTAVAPGFTHTTFHERMGLEQGKEGVNPLMWLDASVVVSESLRDAARGKAVSIPSWRYKAIVAATRILPAGLLARAGKQGRA